MARDLKELLKPIHDAVERLVPTNRALINFVNEKAMGTGLQKSIYKVKFIDKSQKSAKQLANVTLNEFKKHLAEIKLGEEESEILLREATDILDDAEKQIEKVYGDVRRYVLTGELRNACVKNNYRKIPSLNDKQNETVSKEMFALAVDYVNKSDKHNMNDIEDEFQRINHIALTLFNLVAATDTAKDGKKAAKETKSSRGFFDRLWN